MEFCPQKKSIAEFAAYACFYQRQDGQRFKKKSRHAQPLILALAGSLLLALIWRCLHKHVMRIESIQHLCSTPKGTCIYHRRYEAQINLQSPAAIPM